VNTACNNDSLKKCVTLHFSKHMMPNLKGHNKYNFSLYKSSKKSQCFNAYSKFTTLADGRTS